MSTEKLLKNVNVLQEKSAKIRRLLYIVKLKNMKFFMVIIIIKQNGHMFLKNAHIWNFEFFQSRTAIQKCWFRFVLTLVLKLKKTISKDETKYNTFCLNAKAETIIHDSGVGNMFQTMYSTIMTNIRKYQVEGSG